MSKIEELINASLERGVMTEAEHEEILLLVHQDGEIDDQESAQLCRIASAVKSGKLKIIDTVNEECEDEAGQELLTDNQIDQEILAQQLEQANRISKSIDRALEKGVMSQKEHDRIMKQIHADGEIDQAEKTQLSRLFAALQAGELTISDSEREAFQKKLKTTKHLEEAKQRAVEEDEDRESARQIATEQNVASPNKLQESRTIHLPETDLPQENPPDDVFSSVGSAEQPALKHKAETTAPLGQEREGENLEVFMTRARGRRDTGRTFELETDRLLDVRLSGRVWTKTGSMVGYYGSIKFTREGFFEHGVTKTLKKAFTGEGAPLTKATGHGNMYLADMGKKISIIELKGHTLVVNGQNLLAFEEQVNWDITYLRQFAAVWAGGFFNVRLNGNGLAAITTHYDPIILKVSPLDPVMTDMNATVAWSGSLSPQFKTDVSVRTLYGRHSGETVQMRFEGDGFVLIQPYEQTFVEREAEKKK